MTSSIIHQTLSIISPYRLEQLEPPFKTRKSNTHHKSKSNLHAHLSRIFQKPNINIHPTAIRSLFHTSAQLQLSPARCRKHGSVQGHHASQVRGGSAGRCAAGTAGQAALDAKNGFGFWKGKIHGKSPGKNGETYGIYGVLAMETLYESLIFENIVEFFGAIKCCCQFKRYI